jgi:hypothetical protein
MLVMLCRKTVGQSAPFEFLRGAGANCFSCLSVARRFGVKASVETVLLQQAKRLNGHSLAEVRRSRALVGQHETVELVSGDPEA